MKKIKLLVATHKSAKMPSDTDMYLPIHVGKEGKEDIGYIGDNTGQHISEQNDYYSELTALYWAWKNLDCDYLGLVHYRRYLTKKFQNYHEDIEIDDVVLSYEDLIKLLDDNDVLVPKKRNYYISTLYNHYANTLNGNHLDVMREIIKVYESDYLLDYDIVMSQKSGYMFNMFVMRKELADEYCQWLFPLLEKLSKKIDSSSYTPFEKRYLGRVSELLFNVWLNHKDLSVREVPFMYLEKVNILKKGASFLAAKFLGKKYGQSF